MIPFALDTQMPGAEAYLSFLPLIVIMVLFYVMLIRPQKKREKQDKQMRESIVVGDRICTIGGIIGKVVSVHDEDIVIETSGNRMKFYKWAIRSKIENNVEKKDTESKESEEK